MKTAGTIIVALVTVAAVSSPALAGKRKGKKARGAKTEAVEAPRRLCDELGFVTVAGPSTGDKAAPAVALDAAAAAELDAQAIERATAFELSPERRSSSPTGDAAPVVELKRLTDSEINATIFERADEVAYCWNKVPSARRDALQVGLSFTIQPEGTVSALTVTGDAPAKFSACVTQVAKRWTFPHADTSTEVDYPLVFKTRGE
jgi:hypothetical protein